MQHWQLLKIFGQFSGQISFRILPILFLSLTALSLPSCTTSQPPKPFTSEALPTEAIAEISEIRSYPVRVKYINSTNARPATVGVPLKVNESVSTEDTSTAQVTLRSGAIFRIGGNAKLTLKPQNQVELTSGRLVAWASSDRKSPAKITTAFGEISSNDGTLYLEIPDKASEERRLIALDGTVTILLKSTSEIVTVGKGEEIRIKADGKATTPKRIDKESIEKKIANNSLIFGFSTQLASLQQITTEFGVTATVKEASTIQFRRSDLPNKPANDANKPKVTYTSGSADRDRRDEQNNPKREEQAAARNTEPAPAAKAPDPTPVETKAPAPAAPTEPSPVSTSNTPKPVEPAPSQPAPLEPPPQPVQPEVPAPEPPPSNKPPKN